MPLPTGDHVRYGGDHNPEQWPREVWDADTPRSTSRTSRP